MRKRVLGTSLIVLLILALVYFSGGMGQFFKSPTAFAVGDLTVNWGVPEGDPIFVVSDWAPGDTEERTVAVANNAPTDQPVGIRNVTTADPQNLSTQINIEITDGLTTLYGPKTLAEFHDDSNSADGIELSTLPPGGSATYHIIATFDTGAGNDFQNAGVTFDLHIGVAISVPAECGDPSQFGTPIFGTAGNDRIRGGNGPQLIFGLEGNDTLSGGNNKDCLIGGDGNDRLDGGNNNDIILGGEGNNKVDGGNGNDLVITGGGKDVIDLGNGNDEVHAGGGDDQVEGGNGADKLDGESGIDKIDGGLGTDTCEGEKLKRCEMLI